MRRPCRPAEALGRIGRPQWAIALAAVGVRHGDGDGGRV